MSQEIQECQSTININITPRMYRDYNRNTSSADKFGAYLFIAATISSLLNSTLRLAIATMRTQLVNWDTISTIVSIKRPTQQVELTVQLVIL